MSAFCQQLAPGYSYISEKSFKEDHFRTMPTTKQPVLASPAERHPGSVTRSSAALSDGGRKGGEEGEEPRPAQRSRVGAGVGEGESSLYCSMHHTSKENQMNFCV